MSETTVAGLKLVAVDPRAVRPNPWNPNRMDEETFAKEVKSIQDNGFIDPITVRELAGGALEIVDGEHRVKAAVHLGLAEIPATNLGPIPDQQAKKLTIIYNELKGRPEPDLLAKLVKELTDAEPVAELAASLPYSAGELEGLLASTAAFEWMDPVPPAASPAAPKPAVPTGAEQRRVSIGRIAGTVPSWLVNELVAEFERTAAARGSTSVEAVFTDWARRLKETAPEDNTRAKAAPAPARTRKGKGRANGNAKA